MIVKKSVKPKVNDGNGLYDNAGLMDSLIQDCNELVKTLMNGGYITFCALITNMTQKLVNLKKAYLREIETRNDEIQCLMKRLDEMQEGTNHGEQNGTMV